MAEKVVGVKQSRRALREGRAAKVYLAADADPAVTEPIRVLCQERGLPVDCSCRMDELGRSAGIQVGAAVVTILREAL